MDQTSTNPADAPGRSGGVEVSGVPAPHGHATPAVVERHLPATVVRGVVLILTTDRSQQAMQRTQSVADEIGQDGLVSLVANDMPSFGADAADGGGTDVFLPAIIEATDRLAAEWKYRAVPIGYFALHGCVGAALVAASRRPGLVRAVVGVCGNPLDAGAALADVRAPTLFIVDDIDAKCMSVHRRAQHQLHVTNAMKMVADCRHVLDVAEVRRSAVGMARDWFKGFLTRQRA